MGKMRAFLKKVVVFYQVQRYARYLRRKIFLMQIKSFYPKKPIHAAKNLKEYLQFDIKNFKMQQQFTIQAKIEKQTLERIKMRIDEHGPPDEINQLCLDSIQIVGFTEKIRAEICRCTNLQYLTLNHCGLVSLENFPIIPTLVALELISNHITGENIKYICNCQNLEMLALDQNKIDKFNDLEPLNKLVNLEHLEVRGNPFCSNAEYRASIFNLIPKLKIIDCEDQFGDEDVMYGTETQSQSANEDSQDQQNSQEQDQQQDIGGNGGHKFMHF